MEVQTVSSKELAAILRVSPRRIEQLVGEEIVVRVERGSYDLVESVGRYCDSLRTTAETATSSASAELQAERLKAIRVRNAERDGQLIALDEALHIAEQLTGSFVASLVGLPAQIANATVRGGQQANTNARRAIEAVLDGVRSKLVEHLAKAEAELSGGSK